MMIQAVLGNPHHPEYGVATIPFPTACVVIRPLVTITGI